MLQILLYSSRPIISISLLNSTLNGGLQSSHRTPAISSRMAAVDQNYHVCRSYVSAACHGWEITTDVSGKLDRKSRRWGGCRDKWTINIPHCQIRIDAVICHFIYTYHTSNDRHLHVINAVMRGTIVSVVDRRHKTDRRLLAQFNERQTANNAVYQKTHEWPTCFAHGRVLTCQV